jgi:hypothetical protein
MRDIPSSPTVTANGDSIGRKCAIIPQAGSHTVLALGHLSFAGGFLRGRCEADLAEEAFQDSSERFHRISIQSNLCRCKQEVPPRSDPYERQCPLKRLRPGLERVSPSRMAKVTNNIITYRYYTPIYKKCTLQAVCYFYLASIWGISLVPDPVTFRDTTSLVCSIGKDMA